MKSLFTTPLIFCLTVLFASSVLMAQENPLDKVFAYRESMRDGNSVKVQVLVNLKGLSKGKTVKLKEKIPTGFKAKITEAYGSTAEVSDVNVSFTWKVLPQSDLFIVKYELISPEAVDENVSISGNMSYMSDFGIKYVSVTQTEFMNNKDLTYAIRNIPPYKQAAVSVEDNEVTTTQQTVYTQPVQQVADNQPKPKPRTDVTETKTEPQPVKTQVEEKPKPVVTETKTEPQPVKTQVEEKPQPVVTETKTEPQPVKTQVEEKPKPVVNETKTEPQPVSGGTIAGSTGVFYSVQVGASGDKLPGNYYDKYGFDRPVEENLENGMYKYLLGRFSSLKDANAYLAKVKAKGIACFVVAYQDGKRVTVKEALDITKK